MSCVLVKAEVAQSHWPFSWCFCMEMYKPSRLDFLTKTTAKKPRRDDHVRLRALNGLLYKALMDLLCTPEVSQEICDLDVQLSKVGSGPEWEEQGEAGRQCPLTTQPSVSEGPTSVTKPLGSEAT